MPPTKKITPALRRVKEGNWPRPDSRMQAMLALNSAEKAQYAHLYAFVKDTEDLMETLFEVSKLPKPYNGLSAQNWIKIELEFNKLRGHGMLRAERVFTSQYSHDKLKMRELLGLVPPKSERILKSTKKRSDAAKVTGANKSKEVREAKEAAAAAAAAGKKPAVVQKFK